MLRLFSPAVGLMIIGVGFLAAGVTFAVMDPTEIWAQSAVAIFGLTIAVSGALLRFAPAFRRAKGSRNATRTAYRGATIFTVAVAALGVVMILVGAFGDQLWDGVDAEAWIAFGALIVIIFGCAALGFWLRWRRLRAR